MKFVEYRGPSDGVVLPDGTEFPKGKPVEVDAELADALARQGFKVITKSEKGDGK